MTPGRSPDRADALRTAWSELARGHWEQVLALAAPDTGPEELHVRALALWGQGHAAQAEELLAQAVAGPPADAARLSDLGMLRLQRKDWGAASQAFAGALQVQPADLNALQGLAVCLVELARYSEAAKCCREWLAQVPDDAEAHRLLARSLASLNRPEAACAAALRALELEPGSERTLHLLAAIWQGRQCPETALRYSLEAARLHPESATAQGRLASAQWDAGDLAAALEARQRALELGLADMQLLCDLDWIALHDPAQTAAGLLENHRQSAAAWCDGAVPGPRPENARDPDRRLRVGYLSGEFVANAAWCFLSSWLQHHDPAHVETFYYSACPRADLRTEAYRAMAHHWREAWKLSDDDLASQIRADGIDLLVDLSGHYEYNRLGVFARRPAPLSATFPNYPGTTGLAAVDYFLTDRWTTPPGSEPEYAEQPWRLPGGYLVFREPPGIASLPDLPARSHGCVTFGLFQRPGKLNPGVWDAVAGVLKAVPGSRLLIHFACAELDAPNGPQKARLLEPLFRRGIPPERVLFRGGRESAEHFGVIAEADIALDTFPYNGQTTTCDCLWMGVPVVSLRGNTHVARVTPALLERMDLGCMAASSIPEYVQTAAALARDLDALARLRSGLRRQMQAAGLTDGAGLARQVEDACRAMWREWCVRIVG